MNGLKCMGVANISRRILMLFLFVGMMDALALGAARRSFGRVAPNQNDYYSTIAKGVSEQDLKAADVLRGQTINSIHSLLKAKKIKGAREFELYLRLGELYAERHDYIRDQELRVYEQRYAKWENSNKTDKEPTLSVSKSKAELAKAANWFRKLVRKFPRHKRTAAALFSLGKTLGRLGNENAVLYFQQLIRDHKKSELIPDAYLALGEFYFESHQIDRSIDAYTNVMKHKDHKSYIYAVYKLGWSYFNATPKDNEQAKEFSKKAITAFKLVIKLSDRERAGSGRIDLRKEALRDLVMVWADAEEVEGAWAYFKTLGEKGHFNKLLERLGGLYSEQGKNKNAVALYRRLIKENPKRSNNPENFVKMLAQLDQMSAYPNVVKGLEEMGKLFVDDGEWKSAFEKDAKRIAEVKGIVEDATRRYGLTYHSRGAKAKDKKTQLAAISIYDIYLKRFKSNDNSYEVRYFLGDLLFEFKKFDAAADQYSKVLKMKPKKGKYLKDAALNAVVAMNELDQLTKYKALPAKGKVKAPIKLPKVKMKLVKVIDNFAKALPDAAEAHPMRYTAAMTLFDHGYYKTAIRRFAKIVEKHPKSEQAGLSLKMILAYYADRQDWTGVIAWARRFKDKKQVLAAGHAKNILEGLRNAMFNRAMAFETNGENRKAADSFMTFYRDFNKAKGSDRALYNAANNYYKVGAVDKALDSSRMLLKDHPKSNLVAQVTLTAAESYEALTQFSDAAELYARYANDNPKSEGAAGALYNAAVLYKGLEKKEVAQKLFTSYAQKYPRTKFTASAHLEKSELLEKMGKYKEATSSYEGYTRLVKKSNPESAMYGEAKTAELRVHYGDRRAGMAALTKLKSQLGQEGAPSAYDARRIVARMFFEQMEPLFSSFKAIKVTDARWLQREVAAKQKALESAARNYNEIISVGSGEFVVASLYRMGEMHENFASTLFAAPSPTGATQLQVDQYRSGIEKVAFPLRDEAYKFFETAFKSSKEVQTFTEWTRRTYQKMVELAPMKHPEIQDRTVDPEFLSHRLTWSEEVAKLVE